MIVIDGYEWQRFGQGFAKRLEGSSDDWTVVPMDDMSMELLYEIAEKKGARDSRKTNGIRNSPAIVIRSERNKEIASKFGMDADKLAEKLATKKDNDGTLARVPDEEFDSIAVEMGMTPQEMRDRFTGKFFESN